MKHLSTHHLRCCRRHDCHHHRHHLVALSSTRSGCCDRNQKSADINKMLHFIGDKNEKFKCTRVEADNDDDDKLVTDLRRETHGRSRGGRFGTRIAPPQGLGSALPLRGVGTRVAVSAVVAGLHLFGLRASVLVVQVDHRLQNATSRIYEPVRTNEQI